MVAIELDSVETTLDSALKLASDVKLAVAQGRVAIVSSDPMAPVMNICCVSSKIISKSGESPRSMRMPAWPADTPLPTWPEFSSMMLSWTSTVTALTVKLVPVTTMLPLTVSPPVMREPVTLALPVKTELGAVKSISVVAPTWTLPPAPEAFIATEAFRPVTDMITPATEFKVVLPRPVVLTLMLWSTSAVTITVFC